MSSLTEHADRLTQIGQFIQLNASSTATRPDGNLESSIAGPFTRALLETDLGDLIRDIDPTELGKKLDRRSTLLLQASRSNTAKMNEKDLSAVEDPGIDSIRGSFGPLGSMIRARSARRMSMSSEDGRSLVGHRKTVEYPRSSEERVVTGGQYGRQNDRIHDGRGHGWLS